MIGSRNAKKDEIKELVLNLGSLSTSASQSLNEEEAAHRVEHLMQDLAQGYLRRFGFQHRWEGSRKERMAFSVRHGKMDVNGALNVRKGTVELKLQGKVAVEGLQGLTKDYHANEGAAQRIVRDEMSKALRQAFAARSSISASNTLQYVAHKVWAEVQKDVEQFAKTHAAKK
jgi:hypothetical protein